MVENERDDPRPFMLRVKLSRDQESRVKVAARQLGLTLSDFVRQVLDQVETIAVRIKHRKGEK